MTLIYETLTNRAEREIRDAMQRAAACEIGTYGLGLAMGEARGALALWDALVTTIDAVDPARLRGDRARFEALVYAKRTVTA
ncbi:TPA: hypothetical protein QDB15_004848 [Burkholderia vietnamiensis]|uniref:hypothetical protein n=1 Tax=Burkholderia vietnamiensis TaxID=60552 RepID=UPI00159490D1|nr:hypothetical protein [Burkholderia vietnamiensis]MCA8210160.1 hypothetical protein [Burkholderia vietnamiensis]HDR9018049.1 hypothetical protein [Burkholderia vietnamiensis]HDR9101269.1 hypothetical protein [Burkholderia vietnamiensis]HDR9121014.1 hypothetical protein [Burkholderia vietnamiensis]